MDGTDKELFPYLPYILQDLWEIGADPEIIISLIEKHFINHGQTENSGSWLRERRCFNKSSKEIRMQLLRDRCIFLSLYSDARKKAIEYNVEHLCRFEVGDIRLKVKALSSFDIIILGAIGPVFGDYYTTLTSLSGCLNDTGVFIIDDGYIENNSDYTHALIQKRETIIQQIRSAGMQLAEEEIIGRDNIKESDDYIFNILKKRCFELINRYPEKKQLFMDYIEKQKEENDVLENKVICSTMVIRRIGRSNEKPDQSHQKGFSNTVL